MAPRTKNIIAAGCIAIASFALNFIVFIISYNRLATPFLNEEQRVVNAGQIMSVTIGAFAIVAVLTGLAAYWVLRQRS